MAELTIPEPHKSGLLKFLRLPDALVDQIVSAFEGVTPTFYPDELSMEVISKIKGDSSDDLGEMINALVSLNRHRIHDDT